MYKNKALRTNQRKHREENRPIGSTQIRFLSPRLATSSYDSVGYRLIQQDSDSEGEDSQRTLRPGLRTVLRPGPTRDRMFLSVHNKPLIRGAFLAVNVSNSNCEYDYYNLPSIQGDWSDSSDYNYNLDCSLQEGIHLP